MGLLGTMGCGSSFDLDDADLPLLETDQVEYVFTDVDGLSRAVVSYRFINRSTKTLYLRRRCQSLIFERLEVGEWLFVTSGLPCLSNLEVPLVLQPGEVFQDSVRLHEGEPWTTGEYRLRVEVADRWNRDREEFGENIPLRLRLSNSFRLDVP